MKMFPKKVFNSFLISYLMLSVVIMFVFIPFISIASANITKNSAKVNGYILSETSEVFDSFFNDAKNATYSLAYSNILSAITPKSVPTNADYYYVRDVGRYINELLATRPHITNLAVYWYDYDFVISRSGICSCENFFMSYYTDDTTVYNSWREMLRSQSNNFFLTYNDVSKFSYKIDLSQTGSVIRSIVFCDVDASLFRTRINELYTETQSSFILYNEGGKILSFNEYPEMLEKIIFGTDEDFLFLSSKSSLKGWNYGLVVDKSIHLKPVNNMKKIFVCTMLLGLAVTLWYAIYFSRKQYKPISNLVNSIQSVFEANPAAEGLNEFDYLQRYTNALVHQNIDMIDSYTMHRILNGAYDEEDLIIFKKNRPAFLHENFLVILISPNRHDLERLKKESYTKENIQTIFTNVLEELLGENYIMTVTTVNQHYCCILNIENNCGFEMIKKIFENAKRIIFEYFKISFLVAAGGLQGGYGGISVSYYQAVEALRFLELTETDLIILYEELEINEFHLNTTIVKNKMINHLRQGRHEQAYAVFSEMLNSVSENCAFAQAILYRIFALISSVTNSVLPDANPELTEKFDLLNSLLKCKTFGIVKKTIKGYLSLLCEAAFQPPTEKRTAEICKFIDENYMDKSLSATMIGARFNLHPVYISRLFKENLNVTLLEHITAVRIKKAKELIENSFDKFENIASRVGYTNIHTFSRSFKKLEGITPGNYRKQYGKSI